MSSGPILEAMAYMGVSRVKQAWLMARATYAYTRSWDGCEGPREGEVMSFGRWYSFCSAVEVGWEYLWKARGISPREE
jgi:hypothetical protein